MADVRGLLGGGSQAREAAEYSTHRIAFTAVSAPLAPVDGVIDILTTEPEYLAVPVTAAVGAPGLRRKLVEQWGGTAFESIVSSFAWISPTARIGTGSIVAPGAVMTFESVLGEHVILNVGATIGHSTVVGDFATLSPGVHIAGDCSVGAGVFIGIGAVVSHGLSIAPGAVIGAGSTVLEDVTVAGVWVGSPARLVRETPDWIMAL